VNEGEEIPGVPRKRLRVLFADDNDAIATMVEYGLKRAGHFVECVTNGIEALEKILADIGFFDVLITDHEMPHLSGLDLVARLRRTAFAGAIVVHSSSLTNADVEAYLAFGVERFLNKPATMDEMLETVWQAGLGDEA